MENKLEGGPWNVTVFGNVRECCDILTVIVEVREALKLGCQIIVIDKQDSPNKRHETDPARWI